MHHSALFVSTAVVLLLSPPGAQAHHPGMGVDGGGGGGIITIPGSTLPQGVSAMGFNLQFTSMEEIPDAELEALGMADDHVHSMSGMLHATVNYAYGVTEDLTLGIVQPYVKNNDIRNAHHHGGMGEVEVAGDAAGRGDTSIFGQYRLFQRADSHLAMIAGVKMPTGDGSERENGGELFTVEHQPGSGSWDPFAGLAFDRRLGPAGFSANVLYTYTTDGDQQTDLGNLFFYNAALSYPIMRSGEGHTPQHHQHQHTAGILDTLELVLELNGETWGRIEIAGMPEEHSGGHVLYVSPGMRLGFGRRWSAHISCGIPLVNDLNGRQSEPDYRVIGGLSVSF